MVETGASAEILRRKSGQYVVVGYNANFRVIETMNERRCGY